MEAVANVATGAANAAGKLDPSLLMGGSESGSVPGSLASYGAALGLDEAWKNDPRALWSSFAMIIVSSPGAVGACGLR